MDDRRSLDTAKTAEIQPERDHGSGIGHFFDTQQHHMQGTRFEDG
jgi:hypothetical protein